MSETVYEVNQRALELVVLAHALLNAARRAIAQIHGARRADGLCVGLDALGKVSVQARLAKRVETLVDSHDLRRRTRRPARGPVAS